MRLTPPEAFEKALSFFWDEPYSRTVGVAVSGGGDSMALLDLARTSLASSGHVQLRVATVDHQLRQTAQAEIDLVAAYCRTHSVPHDVLVWDGAASEGNLMMAARDGRYALLENWAERHHMDVVLLGHTADDQAETFLMNLARGSGVDGLAGMGQRTRDAFFRPLLKVSREELRVFLQARRIAYADDPTNDDDRFARVRARSMLDHLADLGLTRDRLVQTADHMGQASQALRWAAAEYAKNYTQQDRGDLLLPRSLLYGDTVHNDLGEIGTRVLSGAIRWIGGNAFRPRYKSLRAAAHAVATGTTSTLGGVLMTYERDVIRLSREPDAAVKAPEVTILKGADLDGLWDHRWSITRCNKTGGVFKRVLARSAKPDVNLTIRAIGDSLKDVPDWRDTGLPRASLMATPAVFEGDILVSAPVVGLHNGFTARIVADFTSFLLSR